MSSSGTYTWALSIQDLINEAFDRAGISRMNVTNEQKSSAVLSINLLFTGWQNIAVEQWYVNKGVVKTLQQGINTVTLDARVADILTMVLHRNSRDNEMTAIAASEYRVIPDKTSQGRPDRWFIDRAQQPAVITLWRTPENSTDQIIYDELRMFQDAGKDPLANVDAHRRWNDAICAELAKRMALKFNPARFSLLNTEATEAFNFARRGDRERVDTTMTISRHR